jgi:hypothetical protein
MIEAVSLSPQAAIRTSPGDRSRGRTGRSFREEPTTLSRMTPAEWAVQVQKQAFF